MSPQTSEVDMKIILNEPIDALTAVKLAERFNRDYPSPHKDCVYDGQGLMTYVKRTKAGNLCVNQWKT